MIRQRMCGALVAVVAFVALLGWVGHADAQERYRMDREAMSYMTPDTASAVKIILPVGEVYVATPHDRDGRWLHLVDARRNDMGYILADALRSHARVDGRSSADSGLTGAADSPPRNSRLAGFLTSGPPVTAGTSGEDRPSLTGEVPESPPAGASNSRLAGFLQQTPKPQGQDRHVPSGGFSALVDGQLQIAQASYQEEQRILREREEARRRAEEAARLAREARARAEQERIAQMERERAAQEANESSGFMGSVLGILGGAAIGAGMGLDANAALEVASTFGNIGRAVETGDASDAMAAQASVDSLGARLDAVSPSAGYGDEYGSMPTINKGTDAAASGNEGAFASQAGAQPADLAQRPQENLASNTFQASRPQVRQEVFRAYSDQCGRLSMDVMSMSMQVDRCVGGGGGAFNSNRELREAEARCERQWRPRIDAIEAKYRAECGSGRPGGAVGNQ